jgi:hypothetical protein
MATIDNYPRVVAALCVWREASNQSYAAMLGVAWVERRRITPLHDLVYVVTQHAQFSSMTVRGDSNTVRWPQTSDPSWERACLAVDAVFNGVAPDPTEGATFYFSPPVTEPPADWGAVEATVTLDQLHFYKSVPTPLQQTPP